MKFREVYINYRNVYLRSRSLFKFMTPVSMDSSVSTMISSCSRFSRNYGHCCGVGGARTLSFVFAFVDSDLIFRLK